VALLSAMRERTQNTKLTARTPNSFKEEVEDLRTALQRERRWFYCGEKISLEAIINVAVLEFLRMEPQARALVLQSRIAEIEAMFDAEGPEMEKPAERVAGGEEGRDVEGGGRRLPGPPSVIPPGSTAKPKRRRNQGG
jgi:hypothetical protein